MFLTIYPSAILRIEGVEAQTAEYGRLVRDLERVRTCIDR